MGKTGRIKVSAPGSATPQFIECRKFVKKIIKVLSAQLLTLLSIYKIQYILENMYECFI